MRACIFSVILFLWSLHAALAQPAEKILLDTDKQWYYPGESLWFAVNTFDACSGSPAQLSSVAYVELVGTDARPVVQSKVKINDAQGSGSMVINDDIASGSYTLVAYTNWMRNFGARIFARKPVYIVNPASPARFSTNYAVPDEATETNNGIRLEISNKQVAKRAPVTVKFSVGNRARISVSAYRIDGLGKGSGTLCMSPVPVPCSLALSQPAPFLIERRGHVVSGKVTDLQTQLPAPGVTGYLSAVDYPGRLFMATSDSTGTLQFDVGDLAGETELVLQTDAAGQDKYMIELLSPFADHAAASPAKGDSSVFELNREVIDEALVSAQVQKIFARNNVLPLPDSVNVSPFYGKPDAFYLMSDYVHFSTVEELLREYVANVGVRKRGGKSYPVVYDLKTQKPFREPPLILVNGVPVMDGDRLMKMNTSEFYSIAVVAVKFIAGSHTFHGIIDVRLNTSLKEFGPNARVVDYDGLQLKTRFVSPDYGNELSRVDRKPDFRNVLYWNPLVDTDSNGNGSVTFYTSDLEGEYIVVVQAISRDGQVNISKSFIEVK